MAKGKKCKECAVEPKAPEAPVAAAEPEVGEVVLVHDLVDYLVGIGCVPTKKLAAMTISALFNRIEQEVHSGNKVRIHGFGTFRMKHRAARIARSPLNGEEISVPAKDSMGFKPSKHSSNEAE